MIRSLLRPLSLCLVTLATLGTGSRTAEAQFNVVFPGSTVQGDILNGLGVSSFGAGLYNLNTAQAWSILEDTWMRQNQYLYESRLESDRLRARRFAVRRQRTEDTLGRNHERITNNPELADIHGGATLNALARAITAANFSPSAHRFTRIGVPGGVLQKIPLAHAPTQTVISLARLDVTKDWPLLLREPAFSDCRQQYEAALDRVLAQVAGRELSLPVIDALQHAVDDLRIDLEASAGSAQPIDRNNARAFLDQLSNTTRMLRTTGIEGLLSDVMGYLGTNVADLLYFMERHELRFGRAEDPGERELFESLYSLLAQHREQLLAQAHAARK